MRAPAGRWPWPIPIVLFPILVLAGCGAPAPAALGDDPTLAELRAHVLDRVNEHRTDAGVRTLVAARNAAAQAHAVDMAVHDYIAHWNLRGEGPHLRHTRAGGHDYSAENLAYSPQVERTAAGHCAPRAWGPHLDAIIDGLLASPGHRANLLDPAHRALGIGLAVSCTGVALVQLFEGRYVRFDEVPAIRDRHLVMSGSVWAAAIDERTVVAVAYEPLPAAATVGQLRQTECYSGGPTVAYIRPPAPDGLVYADGGQLWSEVRSRCPTPWEMSDLRWPAEAEAIRSAKQAVRNGRRVRETVHAAWVTAAVWDVAADGDRTRFVIRADLNDVLRTHGPGVYTVALTVTLAGRPQAVTRYALVVD